MEKKFKILMGARQSGHTTWMKDRIKSDLESGFSVGIYCVFNYFDRLKRDIIFKDTKKLHFVGRINTKPLATIKYDKIYIFDFLNLDDKDLDEIKKSSICSEIYCERPSINGTIKKIEFEVARELRKKDILTSNDLFNIGKAGLDIELIQECYNNTMTRPDVDLVFIEPHFDVFGRLNLVNSGTNINKSEMYGLIFE